MLTLDDAVSLSLSLSRVVINNTITYLSVVTVAACSVVFC